MDYAVMVSAEGLNRVEEYAIGIGPMFSLLLEGEAGDVIRPSALFGKARNLNLAMHPYTLLDLFIGELGVDGVLTDNPDVAVQRRSVLASRG